MESQEAAAGLPTVHYRRDIENRCPVTDFGRLFVVADPFGQARQWDDARCACCGSVRSFDALLVSLGGFELPVTVCSLCGDVLTARLVLS